MLARVKGGRVQATAKSAAAPLVCTNAGNIEVLTAFQPVNTVGNLAVLARLLNSWPAKGVLQREAVFVATRGIDNLGGRDGTVGVNPVAPPPTVGGGRVGDLFAIAVSGYWRELSHCETGVDSLAEIVSSCCLRKPI